MGNKQQFQRLKPIFQRLTLTHSKNVANKKAAKNKSSTAKS